MATTDMPTLSAAARAAALFLAKDWQASLEAADEALAEASGETVAVRVELLSIKARVLFLHLGREPEGLRAIEAARRLEPASPRILELVARFRQLSGAAASAFGIQKWLYRHGDKPDRALAGLFEILMERKRYRAAARLAPAMEARNGATPSLKRNLVELALVRHDATAALAIIDGAANPTVPHHLVQFHKIARSLRGELAAGNTMAGYRHLAIAGVAFTGSTAFGVILGSMPGWAFAGETQWLTNVRLPSGEMQSIRDTDAPPERWPVACMVCLRACRCFDMDFRDALAADETGWYAKIADRLGTRNLVTADKNLYLYWELDPLFRFDYIVLYKSPVQHMRSLLKQRLRRPEPRAPLDREWVSANLDRWANNYLGHLKTIRPTGRRVVLEWQAFVDEPGRHMRGLSDGLEIPLAADTLEHIRLGHFIGGNTGVDVAGLKTDPRFVLRHSNAPELPEAVRQIVIEHGRSQRVLRLLETEYKRHFPG